MKCTKKSLKWQLARFTAIFAIGLLLAACGKRQTVSDDTNIEDVVAEESIIETPEEDECDEQAECQTDTIVEDATYRKLKFDKFTGISISGNIKVRGIYDTAKSGIVEVYGQHLCNLDDCIGLDSNVLYLQNNPSHSNNTVIINGNVVNNNDEEVVITKDGNTYIISVGETKNYISVNDHINCNVNGHQIAIHNGNITIDGRSAQLGEVVRGSGDNDTSPIIQSATVYYDELYLLSIAGSGSFDSQMIKSKSDLSISIAGSGKITTGVEASSLNADITGSGLLTLTGNATSANLRITGSGKIDAKGLNCPTVSKQVTGSGTILE